MKGSQIDRSLSYGNISKQLILNSQQETLADAFRRTTRESSEGTSSVNENLTSMQPDDVQRELPNYSAISFIAELTGGFGSSSDVDEDTYKRRKRNNSQNDQQLGR